MTLSERPEMRVNTTAIQMEFNNITMDMRRRKIYVSGYGYTHVQHIWNFSFLFLIEGGGMGV